MPRKIDSTKGDEGDKPAAFCPKCDPPEHMRRELAGGLGAYRGAHYLSYHSTAQLEEHLRAVVSRFPDPPLGETFEGWLRGLLRWHEMKQRWRTADSKRWA